MAAPIQIPNRPICPSLNLTDIRDIDTKYNNNFYCRKRTYFRNI